MPAVTAKLTALVRSVGDTSLLSATRVSEPTAVPVYAASAVSKLDPHVSKATVPVPFAVQENQTEWPPAFPRICGSLLSRVALVVSPAALLLAPESACAFAKASFAG